MNKREILIYDVIGQDWYGNGITAKYIKRELDAAKAEKKDVLIRINSPGGSVFEGIAIYNLLNQYAKEGMNITTQVDGIAMSMAAVIMLGGTKTTAAKNSTILIHNAWGWADGNAKQMRTAAEMLDVFDDNLAGGIADKTGLTVDEVKTKWMDYADHTMTAKAAHEAKLIDELLENSKAKQPENAATMSAQAAFHWFISNKKEDTNASIGQRIWNKLGSIFPPAAKVPFSEVIETESEETEKPEESTTTKEEIAEENKPANNQNQIVEMKQKINALFAKKAEDRTAEDFSAANTEASEEGVTLVASAELIAERAKASKVASDLVAAQTKIDAQNARIADLEQITGHTPQPKKDGNDKIEDSPKDEIALSSVDAEAARLFAKNKKA